MVQFESDLDLQHVAELPDREALSLVNLNAAIPVNLGAASTFSRTVQWPRPVPLRTRPSTRACSVEPRCRLADESCGYTGEVCNFMFLAVVRGAASPPCWLRLRLPPPTSRRLLMPNRPVHFRWW